MKNYIDLIQQTFDFPTEEFSVDQQHLYFHGVSLMDLIQQYGTPLRVTYLPRISSNIQKVKNQFRAAMEKFNYQGDYIYCYCTKSSHFQFVLHEILKNEVHIETSSAFDIQIVQRLYEQGQLGQDRYIICNGFKRPLYLQKIADLILSGFSNCIPVLDNLKELDYYQSRIKEPYQIGIRLASDEEPQFEFYTSRLGVRYHDVVDYYQNTIKDSNAKLKLLHYFINTGMADNAYYWSELSRFMYKYCELKKTCPELDTVDIGGGFPIKTSLHFDYDYKYMIEQIIENIQWICHKNHVPVPHVMTEFGSYTVGESGAMIYSILDQKLQNDKELWYMIDGSFITNLPDTWGLNKKFVLLAINKWHEPFHRVNIGGLTCDSMDYYNSETHSSEVFLPRIDNGQPLYIGFFHTGAYQESLGGYGGIQHCLIPAPQHVIIDHNDDGSINSRVFAVEQDSEEMMKILGYDPAIRKETK